MRDELSRRVKDLYPSALILGTVDGAAAVHTDVPIVREKAGANAAAAKFQHLRNARGPIGARLCDSVCRIVKSSVHRSVRKIHDDSHENGSHQKYQPDDAEDRLCHPEPETPDTLSGGCGRTRPDPVVLDRRKIHAAAGFDRVDRILCLL